MTNFLVIRRWQYKLHLFVSSTAIYLAIGYINYITRKVPVENQPSVWLYYWIPGVVAKLE